MKKRFRDEGETLYYYRNYRIVSCPNCSKPTNYLNNDKISCIKCGYIKNFERNDLLLQVNTELKNYLKIECRGNEIWAINIEHLDFLENYVSAELRERKPNVNRSLASRLPKWMKDKKNRNDILKSISKLKQKLENDGYSPIE